MQNSSMFPGRPGAITKEQSDDFHATIMEKVLNNAQEP